MNQALLAWAKRNERWLSSVFFLAGFIGDIAAFTLLEVSIVNLIFTVYLIFGGTAILLAHYLASHRRERPGRISQTLLVLLPLFIQYEIGAILSGSLIFYTKGAVLGVSWPFLLLLAVVFFGNEIFRSYRDHLAFQTTLFFFGFYAYVIFALPLFIGKLGPWVFGLSSAIALSAFLIFLLVLYRVGESRFRKGFRQIILSSVAIVVLMNGAYFTGLIPPLPLGLKDVRIYHLVEKVPDGYRVLAEPERPWWEFYRPVTVHHVPGAPLYAYSAVFAPIRFSATVVHQWEHLRDGKWQTVNRVSFPVSGGRAEGYRGYSVKTNPEPGRWRVSIKTAEGQTIGRHEFTVEEVYVPPSLSEIMR
ncbi:MAG TPA: DUF2914 domain-containing protein [Candidatus Paceibacterota bacterium]|nr:DUF2914 domain-containing protein [Candidatus Paceibacterota bacterium]